MQAHETLHGLAVRDQTETHMHNTACHSTARSAAHRWRLQLLRLLPAALLGAAVVVVLATVGCGVFRPIRLGCACCRRRTACCCARACCRGAGPSGRTSHAWPREAACTRAASWEGTRPRSKGAGIGAAGSATLLPGRGLLRQACRHRCRRCCRRRRRARGAGASSAGVLHGDTELVLLLTISGIKHRCTKHAPASNGKAALLLPLLTAAGAAAAGAPGAPPSWAAAGRRRRPM